jgi:hypothetical protein
MKRMLQFPLAALPMAAAVLLCSVGGLFLAGCGSSSGKPADSDKPKVEKKKPSKRSMTVGAAGKALAAADEGRVVVTMPEGWRDSMPSKPREGLVAQMKESDVYPYPTIFVRVSPFKEFTTITSSNLEEFVEARREQLLEGLRKKAKNSNVKLAGDVQPVKAKNFRGIEYLKKGRTKEAKGGAGLDLVYLETVVDRRMYTVEMHTLVGDVEKYRPAALTVAANLKFPKAKIEPEEEEEAEAEE